MPGLPLPRSARCRSNRYAFLPASLLSLLLLALLAGGAAAGENLNMIHHSNLDEYAGYSDIWGYTAPGGQEYALLGARTGLSVVNISNRAAPYETGFIAGLTSTWRDIKTYGHYAYVTNEEGGGLLVVDLSDAENPVELPSYHGFDTAHNLYIDESRALIFIAGSDLAGVRILSIGAGGAPTEVAAWTDTYAHDVMAQDDILYVSAIWDGALVVLDYTDLGNITTIGTISGYPGAFTHNAWVTEDGNHVMTTDETSGAPLRLWDISSLPAWSETDNWAPNPNTIPHNAHIKGSLAYVSYYTLGVKVIDISDPNDMTEVGAWDTYPADDSGNYDGSWGVFPFFPNSPGLMVASDMSTGLHVLEYLTSTAVDEAAAAPSPFGLGQNVPNPFNPTTQISMTLAEAGPVDLEIFDALGRRVRVLATGDQGAGRHEFQWDGRDTNGNTLPSGLYLYRASAGARVEQRKMLLLK